VTLRAFLLINPTYPRLSFMLSCIRLSPARQLLLLRFLTHSTQYCARVFAKAVLPGALLFSALSLSAADSKKIVFIAGSPSHGPGEHEHRAGCLLLKSCLDQTPGITSVVYSNGWPEDPTTAFANAATVVVYSDGGGGHPLLRDDHLKTIGKLVDQGVGLVCIHYAVEPTKEAGEKEFLDWIGGCFEVNWSVNPTWTANFQTLPQHPVTRGVTPFKEFDEWYFYMRFRDGMAGVTPILNAVAPASTMDRRDGPHEGNPAVRASVAKGEVQHMAWACERPDGGRGFGFTGGHYHKNWGNDPVRKLVLNAILWTAKIEVPSDGVSSKVTAEDLKKNLDPKGK
jgi:type 1 glutamine amidotransferase